MVIIFSLFVVAAIALYFCFVYVRKNNNGKIAALKNALESLGQSDVQAQFTQLDRLNFTGQSHSELQKVQKEYRQLINGQLPKLAERLNSVIDANEHYRFMIVKGELDEIAKQYRTAQTQLARFKQRAAAMLTQVNDCQKQYEQINQAFADLRKTLLAQNFKFAAAADKLDEQLQTLNQQLTDAKEVMGQADYTLAQTKLAECKKTQTKLAKAMQAIPDMLHQSKNVFPAQLSELSTSFDQLSAQGVGFADDIAKQLTALKDQLEKLTDALTQADVATAEQLEKTLTEEIDHLYDVMQKEYDAKQKVLKQRQVLKKFINHAKERQHVLTIQLDRLAQSYEFTDDEPTACQALGKQLEQISSDFSELEQRLRNPEANKISYSEVATLQRHQMEQLQTIEEQQGKIKTASESLWQQERSAKNSLNDANDTLMQLQHQVRDALLSGLPTSYYEFFRQVNEEIKAATATLNQTKINVKQVQAQVDQISADVDELQKQTATLLENAWLTERLIAHANRYKTRYSTIATAINEASQLFNHQYDYTGALNTIVKALEEVEPGVYEQALSDYRNSKH